MKFDLDEIIKDVILDASRKNTGWKNAPSSGRVSSGPRGRGAAYSYPLGSMIPSGDENDSIETLGEDEGQKTGVPRGRSTHTQQLGVVKMNSDLLKQKKDIHIGHLSRLGRGSFGTAFEITAGQFAGKVLKVTGDETEAKASNSIKGKNTNFIAKIFDVFRFKDSNVYGIVLEKLQPLSPGEQKEFLSAERVLDKLTGETDVITALASMKDWDEFKEVVLEAVEEHSNDPDAMDRASQALDDLENFNIHLIADELRKNGIKFHDYHPGNLMKKGPGHYVIIDLGVSKTQGGGAIPQLESIIMKEVCGCLESKKKDFAGLEIEIEFPAGSMRPWGRPDGDHGETLMKCDYGNIIGYIGADDEEVDIYLGPNEHSEWVYVVHQMKVPEFVEYDEDKVMLGFNSEAEAKAAYLSHYNGNPGFFGGMSSMPLEKFKSKLKQRPTVKITNESFIREDVDSFINALEKNKKRLKMRGIDLKSYINKGNFGAVFDIGSDKVFKITKDEIEAKNSFALKGKNLKHAVRIFDVFRFKAPNDHLFGIVMEKLDPLSSDERWEILEAMQTLEDFEVPLRHPETIKYFKSGNWNGYVGYVMSKGKFKPSGDQTEDDAFQEAKQAIATLEKFQLDKMVEELTKAGVMHWDYHKDNIMRRGSDFVAIDFSLAKSPGQDPPTLENKRIVHLEDLNASAFMKWIDASSKGLVEQSEKVDGSARITLGVDSIGLWFKSKNGSKIRESREFGNSLAMRSLRRAAEVIESAGKDFINKWPRVLESMTGDILYTAVPNSIPYCKEGIVAHSFKFKSGVPKDIREACLKNFFNESTSPLNENVSLSLRERKLSENWSLYKNPVQKGSLLNRLSEQDISRYKSAFIGGRFNECDRLKREFKDKLVKSIRLETSFFGDENGMIEGVVLFNEATGEAVKIVDKESFTKLNSFMWEFREKIHRGHLREGKKFPGVMKSFKDSLALEVLGNRSVRSPVFVKKLAENIAVPKNIRQVSDYVLASYAVKNNLNLKNERAVREALKKSYNDLKTLRNEWDEFKKLNPHVRLSEGRSVQMHEVVIKRTDESFDEAFRYFRATEKKVNQILNLQNEVAKVVGILKIYLGENKLQKLSATAKIDEKENNIPDSIGVTIGRFQPFHAGHASIVRELSKKFDRVIVIVAGNKESEKNPFSFNMRVKLMKASLPDIANKLEVHKAEWEGKESGFLPGVLSEILADDESTTLQKDYAVNVVVGEDRYKDVLNQIESAKKLVKNGRELNLDPSLINVQKMERTVDGEDVKGVSATKVRDALIRDDKESVEKMLDPHVISNPSQFERLYNDLKKEMERFEKRNENINEREDLKSVGDDNVIAAVKASAKNLLNQKGIDVSKLKELGRGQMGIAFDAGNGKVLKVTTDRSEATSSNKIVGKNYNHIVRIEDTFRFKTSDGSKIYGIVQEKLTPLSDQERREVDDAFDLIREKENLLKTIATKSWEHLKQELFDEISKEVAGEIGIPETSPAFQNKVRKVSMRKHSYIVSLLEKYKISEMMKELRNAKIEFADYHSGNIMKRGNDYVINDLGASKSDGAEPAVLEVLDDIVREVFGSTLGGYGSHAATGNAQSSPWSSGMMRKYTEDDIEPEE